MTKANDPVLIGTKLIKNRITMAPTVKFDYAGEDGMAADAHVEHYRKRAAGGAGLICVEATAVTPDGRFCRSHMGIWDDSQIPGQARIAEAIHSEGAAALVQLNHAGSGTFPEMGDSIGPSDLQMGEKKVRGLSLEELHDIQDAFVQAAVRMKKAGYDGVQLHGCHGYLINAFMSPYTNLRNDEYGGKTENRAKFASEIIQKIRELCGPDFIISMRIAGAEKTIEESIEMAEIYVKNGLDYLQVSFGTSQAFESSPDENFSFTSLQQYGKAFYRHFKGRIPVSTVGGILTVEEARSLIENDRTDTIDLARGLLADPAFADAILSGSQYVKCFGCRSCQYGPGEKHRCPAALRRGMKGCD